MFWISQAHAGTFMPPAATKVAEQVDSIYAFLLISSLISFIILMGGLGYFIVKYRRKTANDKTAYITHNSTLEFLWSFIPLVIFMICFFWGAYVYKQMRTYPENALEINVNGKKWDWDFTYKNGRKITSDVNDKNEKVPATMVVPVGRPVKLIMTSIPVNPDDRPVLHSFYVPSFRVKQDLVPGRYTALTFTAEKKGLFNIFCTEYCGTGHSKMLGLIKVVSEEEFNSWILGSDAGGGAGGASPMDIGKKVYSNYACIGCHSLDGSANVGPTWKGLFGSTRNFVDGTSAVADENYLRESILNSKAKIVKGYENGNMPAFAGTLKDDDVTAVIEFIKSLK